MNISTEEMKQLEYLVKKLCGVENVFPFSGVTSQKWQNDTIVSIEHSKKEQVIRREK